MKHRFVAAALAAVISVGAFSTTVQQAIGSAAVAEAAVSVAAPKANMKSGSYYSKSGYYITLTHSSATAKIYYSLNGAAYTRYTGKIAVTKNSTLKFYAVVNGAKSKVVTNTYKYFAKANVSLASGTYAGAQTVKLTSPASNVKFYYTLDGTTPTTKSKLYNASTGIKITKSCKLRYIAYKSNWSYQIYTNSYTIKNASLGTETAASEKSIVDDYTVKYAYSTLTADQKKVYAAIYEGIKNHEETVEFKHNGLTQEELQKVFWCVSYDNSEFYWLGKGYASTIGSTGCSLNPIYTKTKAEVRSMDARVKAAAQEIIDGALKLDTQFERIKYIHDSIAGMTTYDSSDWDKNSDLDAVLLNGRALCEGYARTFAYLCQSIGINTTCVAGETEAGGHMWNLVQLDGEWYHMDVTYDDPVSSTPMIRYDYFCVTEAKMREERTVEKNEYPLPRATATKYNYHKYLGITVYDNATTAYNALAKQIVSNYNKGIKITEIACDEDILASLHKKVALSLEAYLRSNGINSGYSYGYANSKYKVTLS